MVFYNETYLLWWSFVRGMQYLKTIARALNNIYVAGGGAGPGDG
jgi:hypothetical protein